MTPVVDDFVDYQTHQSTIVSGDGKQLESVAIGTVLLSTLVSGHRVQLQLQGVLHVPHLVTSLLSVGKAAAAGVHVQFRNTRCFFSVGKKTVLVANKSPGSGLYKVLSASASHAATFMAAAPETAQLWHKRFGHFGYQNLAKMVKNNIVEGIHVLPKQFQDAARDDVCKVAVYLTERVQPP